MTHTHTPGLHAYVYQYSPCNPFSQGTEKVVEYWGYTLKTNEKTKSGEFKAYRDKNGRCVEVGKFKTRAECEAAANTAIAKAEGR